MFETKEPVLSKIMKATFNIDHELQEILQLAVEISLPSERVVQED
jgi:hypothetical protein